MCSSDNAQGSRKGKLMVFDQRAPGAVRSQEDGCHLITNTNRNHIQHQLEVWGGFKYTTQIPELLNFIFSWYFRIFVVSSDFVAFFLSRLCLASVPCGKACSCPPFLNIIVTQRSQVRSNHVLRRAYAKEHF